MEIKKFEAYNINDEYYSDFAEEHAKVVIASYIDKELDGKSLQDCFDKMVEEWDLKGAADGNELVETSRDALINVLYRMLEDAKNIYVD